VSEATEFTIAQYCMAQQFSDKQEAEDALIDVMVETVSGTPERAQAYFTNIDQISSLTNTNIGTILCP